MGNGVAKWYANKTNMQNAMEVSLLFGLLDVFVSGGTSKSMSIPSNTIRLFDINSIGQRCPNTGMTSICIEIIRKSETAALTRGGPHHILTYTDSFVYIYLACGACIFQLNRQKWFSRHSSVCYYFYARIWGAARACVCEQRVRMWYGTSDTNREHVYMILYLCGPCSHSSHTHTHTHVTYMHKCTIHFCFLLMMCAYMRVCSIVSAFNHQLCRQSN